MPIYEFVCKCGEELSKLVKMDIKTTKCPSCGRRMKKVISSTSFILNGRNWAKDNYGLKKEQKKGVSKGEKRMGA